jgi:hypothetical protein
MRQKTSMCLLFFLVVTMAFSHAQCFPENTPTLIMDSVWHINEGERFIYRINLSTDLQAAFSWVPINFSLDRFDINRWTGRINITPHFSETGQHSLFIIATTPEGCYDMRRVDITVFDRPIISWHSPQSRTLTINETEYIFFRINASVSSGAIRYEWYRNNRLARNNSHEYRFITNYTDSGMHSVVAAAIDERGLNSSYAWEITVLNKNRRPYVKFPLPNLVVTPETEGGLFNIYNYIADPDNEKLVFDVYFVDEARPDELRNQSRVFNISVDDIGIVSIKRVSDLFLTQFVRIRATDPHGASAITQPFMVRFATSEDKFEFFQQLPKTEKCIIDIVCADWSECLPEGLRVRECFDQNNCNQENNIFVESEECDYDATCFDGIKNQGEEGIDCGGPCEPCATCFDGIKNQGEEGIDCGGPCEPCPTCFDGVQNQGETDVDCGGPCRPCIAGNNCKRHSDCESLVCTDNICQTATCSDFRQNQGEEGIDCGGPCEPCETCFDGIQNQGEE